MKIGGMVLGDEALTKQFQKLSEMAKSKVIRQATNYAMTPVLQEARSRAPSSTEPHKTYKGRIVMPGFLKRSLTKRTKQSKNRYVTRTKVGAAGKEAFYGIFVERGIAGTKRIPPRLFLQESLGARRHEVVDRYKEKLRQAIGREAKKRVGKIRASVHRDLFS